MLILNLNIVLYNTYTSHVARDRTAETSNFVMISQPSVSVNRVLISPDGPVPLESGLDVTIDFACDTSIPSAYWDLSYVVDCAGKRHIVELGRVDCQVAPGTNSILFTTPSIDFSTVKRSVLLNVGLLIASLKGDSDREILQISFVTNVDKSGPGSSLVRTIFNPLD